MSSGRGALDGVRIVEFAGLGPGPFAAMLLADMGAEVLRVDRLDQVGDPATGEPGRGEVGAGQVGAGGRGAAPAASTAGTVPTARTDLLGRGRRSVAVDLKHPAGAGIVRGLVDRADVLIEGFRPGVMERLGLGPDDCRARNPRLVYGRMTGWGQDGPLAGHAGHDINYIALTGALHAIGLAGEAPVPPLNLVGDFGGGGTFLAFGIVCALLERERSGEGQVVDAAMVDGAAVLSTYVLGERAAGSWVDERGVNLLDGGAPFYGVYETADGGFVSIGPLEPRFYERLLSHLGPEVARDLPEQMDRSSWPAVKERFARVFRGRTRDEWCELLGSDPDVCFAPVLSFAEAQSHPHTTARGTFVEVGGVVQPAPAPRLSRTPGAIRRPPPRPGEHTDEALADWGVPAADVERAREAGAVR